MLSFSVAASCTAVYLLCYSLWGRSCVGFMVWSLLSGGVRGVFMAGGVLEELQRLCWGIWCVRLLSGYCSSILRKCKNVLLC